MNSIIRFQVVIGIACNLLISNLKGNETSRTTLVDDNLGKLGTLQGAVYDEKNSMVILIGNGLDLSGSPTISQVATAFHWAVLDSPESFYTSIDPWPGNPKAPWMKVLLNDNAVDKQFGWVMFEADRVLKSYSLGFDNLTGLPAPSQVPGFLAVHQINSSRVNSNRPVWSRFWFYSKDLRVVSNSGSIQIRRAQLAVKTENMVEQKGELVPARGQTDPAAEQFASHFNNHFKEFSDENPIFLQLEQQLRLLAVAQWLHKNKIPVSLEWLHRYHGKFFATPRVTPSISFELDEESTKGNIVTKLTISAFGGVDLKPNTIFEKGDSQALENTVLALGLKKSSASTPFVFNGNNFVAVPLSWNYPRPVTPLLKVPIDNGKQINVATWQADRSPEVGIALPELRSFKVGGLSGKFASFGIQGMEESTVDVRVYELYDREGNLDATFKNHQIDQVNQRVEVVSEGDKRWRLYPKKDGSTWATDGNQILAFDIGSGKLIGEQFDDQLVRYSYSKRGILQSIKNEAGKGVEFDLGFNGSRLLAVSTTDGQRASLSRRNQEMARSEARSTAVGTVAGLPKRRVQGKRNFEFIDELGNKISATIDLASGDYQLIPGDYYSAFLNWVAPKISEHLALNHEVTTPVAMIEEGGCILFMVGDKVRVIGMSYQNFKKALANRFVARDTEPGKEFGFKKLVAEMVKLIVEEGALGKSLTIYSHTSEENVEQQIAYLARAVDEKFNIQITSNFEKSELNQSRIKETTPPRIKTDIGVLCKSDEHQIPVAEVMKDFLRSNPESPLKLIVGHTDEDIDHHLEDHAPNCRGKVVCLLNCGHPGELSKRRKRYEKLIHEHGALSIKGVDKTIDVDVMKALSDRIEKIDLEPNLLNPIQLFDRAVDELIEEGTIQRIEDLKALQRSPWFSDCLDILMKQIINPNTSQNVGDLG